MFNDNENNSHLEVELNMIIHLADLAVGDKARIIGFNSGCPEYQQKLLALGLVPKAEFKVVRVAPLGDPIEIKIYNSSICVRRKEGAILKLERLPHE